MTTTYEEFVASKVDFEQFYGHDATPDQVHPLLKPHQRAIVCWAVKGGRRAIFAAFGIGKSVMQIETLRLTLEAAGPGARALIVCPLGVRIEFAHDAAMLGVQTRFVRRSEEVDGPGIYVTNYESVRDGKLDVDLFTAVSLDEASVLRSFGSKTYQEFLTLFDHVPYRFVATATPSPNRYKELIHYAGFLGVMDTGNALTRFFQRDSTKANNLTLYPHKREEFFLWLNTWAVFLQRPSDICRCTCHVPMPISRASGSAASSPSSGHPAPEPPAGGSAGATAAESASRAAATSRAGALEAAAACDPGTAAKGRANTGPGKPCTTAAGGRSTKTGVTTADEESACATAGSPSSSSSLISGRGLREQPSTESTTTATTSPATVDGPARLSRQQTGASTGAANWCDACRCDEGYDLPPLQTVWHEVDVAEDDEPQVDRDGQGHLVRGVALGLPEAAAEKRRSLPARVAELMAIVRDHHGRDLCRSCAGPADQLQVPHRAGTCRDCGAAVDAVYEARDQIILWCDLNDEQRAIEQALAADGITYSSIHGSLDPDDVEARLAQWKSRQTYALIGKPVMLGQGMNLQQCNTAVYVGITFKFNDLIQSLHRIQRYGQTRPCTAHLIHAESEREVVQTIRAKWSQHKELTATMTQIIREHGLSHDSIAAALTRSIGVDRITAQGEGWFVANNDCVSETRDHMGENEVDLIVTSIPFSNHYEYTPAYEDFGHTDNNDHFWEQMDFLTPQLLKVLRPGRIYACHVKDRILFGNVTGAGIPTVSPFHAEAIAHGLKHGFDYMGMITVVTDVVRENNQTYRLGWSEQCKDGTKMGVGSPEYILLFHKPQTDRSHGYADVPVTKDKGEYTRARWQVDAHAFWRSSGNRFLTPEELASLPVEERSRLFTEQTLRDVYDYEAHIAVGEALEGRGALPATFMSLAPGSWHPDVWHDVNRMLTLNTEQSRRAQAMHVCPLQFDIVDRLIRRYSNPGELVFDPFGGLFTVPVRALTLGRTGRAVELNAGYFLDGVKYLQAEERKRSMPALFDLAEGAA